jgi:hypothetical protein
MVKKKKEKQTKKLDSLKTKFSLVVKRLLFFSLLAIVLLILSSLANNSLLKNLFFVFAMASGFISVGFLIVLLILFILKFLRKK